MFVDKDRIGAAVRIDAMLGEARRALSDAERDFEYCKKEYDRAQVRYESAKGVVQLLEEMQTDVDEVKKLNEAYRKHRF